MKAILQLAARSAWSRRSTLGLMLASIMLSTALLLAIERIRVDTRQSFRQSVAGVDLVIGARTGATQLILHAIFHSGSPPLALKWESYQAIATHPATEWSLPLALGDSHRNHPVLGTSPDFFRHFRHGDRQPLRFKEGRPFEKLFEAVLGSEVAERLGYTNGQQIVLSHGLADGGALATGHDDKPFVIVGILSPTGTPVDRTIHVSLESITALHLDWVAGAPMSGLNIPAAMVAKFDLTPKDLSAVLVGLKQRTDVFRMQRFVNEYRGEALTAVLPGVALDELWQTIGIMERTLLGISALVVLVGLCGLAATLLAGLNERRRELAILRALGAGPREIFALLTLEGLIVTTAGALLGVLVVSLAGAFAAPALLSAFGIVLSAGAPSADELTLLAAIVGTGLLASLIPGWRAWRMSLADGLTPRA